MRRGLLGRASTEGSIGAVSAHVSHHLPLVEELYQQTLALGFQELTGQTPKRSLQAKTRSGCRGLKSL